MVSKLEVAGMYTPYGHSLSFSVLIVNSHKHSTNMLNVEIIGHLQKLGKKGLKNRPPLDESQAIFMASQPKRLRLPRGTLIAAANSLNDA